MKLQQKLTLILITLFLTLFISACKNDNNDNKNNNKSFIKDKQLNTTSGEEISIKAIQAKAYSWKQISGIEVILINANTDTLSFIAPIVQTNETLVFELEALKSSAIGSDSIIKERATITISPLKISTDTNTTTPTPTTQTLKSIKLTIEKTSLNLDENTTLNVIATYSDNTTKDVTNKVEWLISNSNTVQITKHNLKTIQDKNIILKAKLHNITSNAVALEIYNEINGHRLPPKPNKTLNDSTLLGIDVNDNGVRDDVERWIYETYTEPVEIGIFMQSARAFQKVIQDPNKAHETIKFIHDTLSCEFYLMDENQDFKEKYEYKDPSEKLKTIQLNTLDRHISYEKYNGNLSGGVYSLVRKNIEKCEFDENGILRD